MYLVQSFEIFTQFIKFRFQPRSLSNDSRFIQYIYRNSDASKRFMDVKLPSRARSEVFGLSLDLHVLPYFVDYNRTDAGCALKQARLSLCCWQVR